MARSRILFVVPLLRRAGAETQLVVLANRLPEQEFEKHLVSYRPGDDLKDDIDTDRVTFHELERRGRIDLRVAKQIGRIIDEADIQVVHCTLQNALLYGYLGVCYAKRRPKLIVSVHTTKNAGLKLDLADRLVYVPLFRKCDQIWFVSEVQAQLWTERHAFIMDRAEIIHNGIDTRFFDSESFRQAGVDLRRRLEIDPEVPVLCSIAGFRTEKLHSVLIEAMKVVRDNGLGCELLLAGTGPLESAIRQQVRRLDLEDRVHFLGSLADVRPALAAADCKILVSAAETFSMAMLEAMAMELPVITTTVGGAREAIEDGVSGFLIPPGDATLLAERIRAVAGDPAKSRAMGKRARCRVECQFSVEQMVNSSARQLKR